MRSDGLERSNPETGTVLDERGSSGSSGGINRQTWGWRVSPKILVISTVLDSAHGLAVTDFSYSETDHGFVQVRDVPDLRSPVRRRPCVFTG